MKIVGMEIKQGAFKKDGNEIVYNNLVMHTTSETLEIVRDENGKIKRWGIGSQVDTHKVKNEEETLCEVFGVKTISEDFLKSLIGKDINIFYNMYGRINKIEVVKA